MITVKYTLLALNEETHEPLNFYYNPLKKSSVNNYLKLNKMPKDEAYSEEDLKFDLFSTYGIFTLSLKIKEETRMFIETMLNKMV